MNAKHIRELLISCLTARNDFTNFSFIFDSNRRNCHKAYQSNRLKGTKNLPTGPIGNKDSVKKNVPNFWRAA
jgi:hypothetical protein